MIKIINKLRITECKLKMLVINIFNFSFIPHKVSAIENKMNRKKIYVYSYFQESACNCSLLI